MKNYDVRLRDPAGLGYFHRAPCRRGNAQTNGPCPNWSYNTANNRLTNSGVTYDAAGNMTADGSGAGTYTYTWDAEGRLMSTVSNGTTASYTYNALGQLVQNGATATFDALGQNVQVGSVANAYDIFGQIVGAYNVTGGRWLSPAPLIPGHGIREERRPPEPRSS